MSLNSSKEWNTLLSTMPQIASTMLRKTVSDRPTSDGARDQQVDEEVEVAQADAVSDPETVMVELCHAIVAFAAVRG